MRMVFTQYVTDGTGRFFKFGAGIQAQFRHRIHNAALNRFQTITNKRQRTVHDHVHGVV
ncbi:Uncharacterised protein [Shigella sonnei]|nr:Uncharacterised protein [Shigella sonnei]